MKRWNKFILIGIMTIFILIIILSYLWVKTPKYETSLIGLEIELVYIGKDNNGDYLVEINNTHKDHPLSEVYIYIGQIANKLNFSDNGITLAQAKQNYQNTSYNSNFTYNDKDNNDVLSSGDIILVRSEENKGFGRDGQWIRLYYFDKYTFNNMGLCELGYYWSVKT